MSAHPAAQWSDYGRYVTPCDDCRWGCKCDGSPPGLGRMLELCSACARSGRGQKGQTYGRNEEFVRNMNQVYVEENAQWDQWVAQTSGGAAADRRMPRRPTGPRDNMGQVIRVQSRPQSANAVLREMKTLSTTRYRQKKQDIEDRHEAYRRPSSRPSYASRPSSARGTSAPSRPPSARPGEEEHQARYAKQFFHRLQEAIVEQELDRAEVAGPAGQKAARLERLWKDTLKPERPPAPRKVETRPSPPSRRRPQSAPSGARRYRPVDASQR